MIEVDFSLVYESEDIDVVMTHHGSERAKSRDGQVLNINKEEIEDLVNKSSDVLTKSFGKFKTFVIHGIKSNLNVVGELIHKGTHWIFKVITVMLKNTFDPREYDKYVEVYESLESEGLRIFGLKNLRYLRYFEEFVQNSK